MVNGFFGRSVLPARMSAEDDDEDIRITGPDSSSYGFPVAIADFDGDGIADMAFGAQLQSSGELSRQGAVYVIRGSGDLGREVEAAAVAQVRINGSMTGELMPSSIATADLTGDGRADLVVGSSLGGPEDRAGAGVVHVFTDVGGLSGSVDLMRDAAPLTLIGAAADDRLGGALFGGVTSDGNAVILALAALADAGDGDPDTGIVYVIPVGE
jgi:hypothetical protein